MLINAVLWIYVEDQGLEVHVVCKRFRFILVSMIQRLVVDVVTSI